LGLDLCGDNRSVPPTNVAMIFGNNASGKTNLISAIEFFRDIFSFYPGPSVPLHFAHQNNDNRQIHIQSEMVLNGHSFWYENTLRTAPDMIESVNETLTVIPYQTNHEKTLFQYDNSAQEALHLPSYLVKAKITEPENQQYVKQFISYIKNIKIVSKQFESYLNDVANHLMQDNALKQALLVMIREFDLHISDIDEQRHDFLNGQIHIQFHHQDLGRRLPLAYESHGTLGLYVLLYFLLLTLRDNGLLLVDEIENALHPDIVEVMIRIIKKNDLQKSPRYPQFIFTTHQTELMKLLDSKRAIFLAEKNHRGATKISSAEDFVHLGDVIEAYQQYKLGRLGAVPILSEKLEDLAVQLRALPTKSDSSLLNNNI
jgi:AAA15 family ATPase/GTPase